MLLRFIVGITMADEASDTFGGGLRNYLGALAFISALIGAEIIREHGPLWVGVILIVIALPDLSFTNRMALN